MQTKLTEQDLRQAMNEILPGHHVREVVDRAQEIKDERIEKTISKSNGICAVLGHRVGNDDSTCMRCGNVLQTEFD